MAALDDINLTKLAQATGPGDLRTQIAREFWTWYELHKNDAVITLNIWIAKKTFRVMDVMPLFVRLFGAEPSDIVQV